MAATPINGSNKYWCEGLPVVIARTSAAPTGENQHWLEGMPFVIKDVSTSATPPGKSSTWMGTDTGGAWVG
jgi:hypothetical protein